MQSDTWTINNPMHDLEDGFRAAQSGKRRDPARSASWQTGFGMFTVAVNSQFLMLEEMERARKLERLNAVLREF
jgi:hypothetical protein